MKQFKLTARTVALGGAFGYVAGLVGLAVVGSWEAVATVVIVPSIFLGVAGLFLHLEGARDGR